MTTTTRIVEVRRNVLKANDTIAHELRERFARAGVCVISVVSSPGSGKTAFLERVLSILHAGGVRVAALVGDLATDNDAIRLARSGAPVKQIVTGATCHLDASMVRRALEDWTLEDLDFLFVENVGNLVCPASYDLGEQARLVLLSVTEGEDKPLKYPSIFNSADIAVITKADLAEAVDFNYPLACANILMARPDMEIRYVSAKTGYRMDSLVDWILAQRGFVEGGVG